MKIISTTPGYGREENPYSFSQQCNAPKLQMQDQWQKWESEHPQTVLIFPDGTAPTEPGVYLKVGEGTQFTLNTSADIWFTCSDENHKYSFKYVKEMGYKTRPVFIIAPKLKGEKPHECQHEALQVITSTKLEDFEYCPMCRYSRNLKDKVTHTEPISHDREKGELVEVETGNRVKLMDDNQGRIQSIKEISGTHQQPETVETVECGLDRISDAAVIGFNERLGKKEDVAYFLGVLDGAMYEQGYQESKYKDILSYLHNLIFIGSQRAIWDTLTDLPQFTKDISITTGIGSKNVSTQLNQMSRTGLVHFETVGRLKKWYRSAGHTAAKKATIKQVIEVVEGMKFPTEGNKHQKSYNQALTDIINELKKIR